MKYLITGGLGFLGTNLALEVLKQREELFIFDNLFRHGSQFNLEYLKAKGKFSFHHGDIRNSNDVVCLVRTIKPDVIFHLAGQVAMTTSLSNPRLDFEINTIGSFNLLDAVQKYSTKSIIIYSSTNKVYGDLADLTYLEVGNRYVCKEHPNGFNESLSLNFSSPYGCSKGSADQYFLDYYRMFNMKTVVFRHSSMYGINQFPTFDQGWVGWFCKKALDYKTNNKLKPITISGNGKQVRDLLYVSDLVDLYFMSVSKIDKVKGNVFNIGGGIENSLSILELLNYLGNRYDLNVRYICIEPRKSDQKVFIADLTKIVNKINWSPKINVNDGIDRFINWFATFNSK